MGLTTQAAAAALATALCVLGVHALDASTLPINSGGELSPGWVVAAKGCTQCDLRSVVQVCPCSLGIAHLQSERRCQTCRCHCLWPQAREGQPAAASLQVAPWGAFALQATAKGSGIPGDAVLGMWVRGVGLVQAALQLQDTQGGRISRWAAWDALFTGYAHCMHNLAMHQQSACWPHSLQHERIPGFTIGSGLCTG